MRIRIEATDLPGSACHPSGAQPGGYRNIHVAVQRRAKPKELLGLTSGAAASATWALDCEAVTRPDGAADLKGPYIQGPPGGRFIYLSWGEVSGDGEFTMFRRAKLWLDAVPPGVLEAAMNSGVLTGRLGLTDAKGNPLCAAIRPPLIEWS